MCKYCTAIFVFTLLIILTACEEISFLQSQPPGAKALREFPEEIQGLYISADQDTLFVNARVLSLYNRSNPCDKLSDQDSLSDLIKLTRSADHYFLNVNEHGTWSVLMIDNQPDNSIVVSMVTSEDEAILEAVGDITEIDFRKDEAGEIVGYVINPSKDEFFGLIEHGLFRPIAVLRKIDN